MGADAGTTDGCETAPAAAAGASSKRPRARANAAAETPTVAPFPVTNANADEPGVPVDAVPAVPVPGVVAVPASSFGSPSIARARRIAASDTATGFPLPVANAPPARGGGARHAFSSRDDRLSRFSAVSSAKRPRARRIAAADTVSVFPAPVVNASKPPTSGVLAGAGTSGRGAFSAESSPKRRRARRTASSETITAAPFPVVNPPKPTPTGGAIAAGEGTGSSEPPSNENPNPPSPPPSPSVSSSPSGPLPSGDFSTRSAPSARPLAVVMVTPGPGPGPADTGASSRLSRLPYLGVRGVAAAAAAAAAARIGPNARGDGAGVRSRLARLAKDPYDAGTAGVPLAGVYAAGDGYLNPRRPPPTAPRATKPPTAAAASRGALK